MTAAEAWREAKREGEDAWPFGGKDATAVEAWKEAKREGEDD